MEDAGSKNGEDKVGKESSDGAADIQANTSAKASQKAHEQPTQRKGKKWTLRQHWQRASTAKRLKWAVEGIGVIVGLLILANYFWGNLQTMWNFRAEHAPLIVHSQPPKFLQSFKRIPLAHIRYDTGKSFPHGDFQFGNIVKTYKNIGNETAYDVSGMIFAEMIVIPTKDSAKSISDQEPKLAPKDCTTDWKLPGAPLEPGGESSVVLLNGSASVPPEVQQGDSVFVEYKTCTTYADSAEGRHGTCDLYRLVTHDVQDLPRAYSVLGTPELPCDGVERTAEFVAVTGGHCQN